MAGLMIESAWTATGTTASQREARSPSRSGVLLAVAGSRSILRERGMVGIFLPGDAVACTGDGVIAEAPAVRIVACSKGSHECSPSVRDRSRFVIPGGRETIDALISSGRPEIEMEIVRCFLRGFLPQSPQGSVREVSSERLEVRMIEILMKESERLPSK